ncbi:LysR family transcriptional regulator [Bordetella genomosp. 9]|uniref:LysR family transcriptional regulator n=1 Tax=Bordetella genomosp. 9 TaxID=1416803 RepID=A0A1W6Z0N1_9BORD|nr:LysR family transcriptional regulator [Bordetella genomosp. 9]ARP86868.1 LysR family transcriptional regulator [Bordetella genomosp. 9]
MELRHLRYFVAVAEEKNFTRAAARLGIGQPPLSQQIRQLEDELGAPLFLRLPRGIELTEAGQQFLADSRDVLNAAARAADQARRLGRGESGTLTVGFTASSVFHPALARALRAYRDEYPGVRVALREGNTGVLVESLRRGEVDVAFLRPPYALDEQYGARRIVDEAMLAALPAGHPLAGRKSLRVADLRDEPFVLFPRPVGSGLYDAIYAACLRAGFRPRIGQEAPQMASIVSLVAAGFGISLVPESLRHVHSEGIRYVPLRGDAPRALLELAYPLHPPSQAVRNAVEVMTHAGTTRDAPSSAPNVRPAPRRRGRAPHH